MIRRSGSHQSGARAALLVLACAVALHVGWVATADAKPKECKIAGIKFADGAVNPANHCQSCQPDVDDKGWTNRPAGATCGGARNGQCDAQNTCDGAGTCIDNVQPATARCTGTSNGGACNNDAGDHCSGTDKTCVDVFRPSTSVCRAAAGQCDVPEYCTGTGAACPPDARQPQGTACSDDGKRCTLDQCDGTHIRCQHPAGHAGTVCRPAAGVCDRAETCDGANVDCPPDLFLEQVTCRPQAGLCDIAEQCTGTGPNCPGNQLEPSGKGCRLPQDECDRGATCSGTNAACPGNSRQSAGTACSDDGNPCTLDQCDGVTISCQHPAGHAGTVCRPAVDVCDVAETCDGTSKGCPPDAFQPSTTVCRPAAGVCDDEEACDGTGPACPPDSFKPDNTVCRPSAGPCDVAEKCTGTSVDCPADMFNVANLCRPAADVCDDEEACDGTGPDCPPDAVKDLTTVCRPAAGPCDRRELCDGVSTACPADKFNNNRVCRTAEGPCDEQEFCDGTSALCPPDLITPASAICRPSVSHCDVAEVCDGTTIDCPVDAFKPAAMACTGTSQGGPCDDNVHDHCSGTNSTCVDAFQPATTVCRAAGATEVGGIPFADSDCDEPETCTGSDGLCPADVLKPAGFVCRQAAGPCDLTEHCDGSFKGCPTDALVGAGTKCGDPDPAKLCDGGGFCDGVRGTCTERPKQGTVCRPAAPVCDVAETCDGTSLDCPPDGVSPAGTPCQTGPCYNTGACLGSFAVCDYSAYSGGAQFKDKFTQCGDPLPQKPECTLFAYPVCVNFFGTCGFAKEDNGTICVAGGVQGTCNSGTCEPSTVVCKYNIQCADGFVCDGTNCVAAPAGQTGASCTGGAGECGSGLLCCARMLQNSGLGFEASSGQAGRCAACCGGPCAGGFGLCCDGVCNGVRDVHNCGVCAYDGGDCFQGLNACFPNTGCLSVDGVCRYTSGCPALSECTLPNTGAVAPECITQCYSNYTTCFAACGTEAGCESNCQLFLYVCTQSCPLQVDPSCTNQASGYAGCTVTCTPVNQCSSAGAVCTVSSDCCSGTCKSTCPPGLGGLNCTEPSYCQ